MASGGAQPKRRGTYAEYAVRNYLQRHGWIVVRAYASEGPWDLLALQKGHAPMMVQVKSGASYKGRASDMAPEERRRLKAVAAASGAVPVLVTYRADNRGMRSAIWTAL